MPLMRQCGKHGRARQVTDDNIIWCRKVCSACQITMAITEDTHKIIFNTYYCPEQYEISSSLTMMHIHIHGNNKYFYIADSHIYANNKHGTTVVFPQQNI